MARIAVAAVVGLLVFPWLGAVCPAEPAITACSRLAARAAGRPFVGQSLTVESGSTGPAWGRAAERSAGHDSGYAAGGVGAMGSSMLQSLASASDPSLADVVEPEAHLAIPWLPASVDRWAPLIVPAARRHGVDPHLVAIVMLVESGGNPRAVSPSGARGLMQVMPATGVDIATRRGLQHSDAALSDPVTNIDFGAWYLADQLRRFGTADDLDWRNSVALAAAAYNGGPGHVASHLGGAPLASESSYYREWVSGMWSERKGDNSPTFERWMEAGGWRLVTAAIAAAPPVSSNSAPSEAPADPKPSSSEG